MGDLKLVKKFDVTDGFWGRYEKLVKEVVLPYQEDALNDRIEGAEKSHCIENFRMAAALTGRMYPSSARTASAPPSWQNGWKVRHIRWRSMRIRNLRKDATKLLN